VAVSGCRADHLGDSIPAAAGGPCHPACTFTRIGVVKEYGWLNDQQFLDAVAVSMVTPGPVVITVFIDGWQPDYPRVLVLAATLFLLTRFRRLSEPWVVAGAAILGLLLFPFLSR